LRAARSVTLKKQPGFRRLKIAEMRITAFLFLVLARGISCVKLLEFM
jgi:hypothetical protein